MNRKILALAALLSAWAAYPAHADMLEDIISAGKLRCAVTLGIPPNGFRNQQNEPDGFDVDYCKDLAKALGVEPVIVETEQPDRIPALVTYRADVAVASISDTWNGQDRGILNTVFCISRRHFNEKRHRHHFHRNHQGAHDGLTRRHIRSAKMGNRCQEAC